MTITETRYKGYFVDYEGNVYSNKNGNFIKLKPMISSYGYPIISIKGKKVKVHRLVAETFIPNPFNKPCIDHINTIKTDNRALNLRWCTHKENANNPLTLLHNKESQRKHIYTYDQLLSRKIIMLQYNNYEFINPTMYVRHLNIKRKHKNYCVRDEAYRKKMSEVKKGKPNINGRKYDYNQLKKIIEENKNKMSFRKMEKFLGVSSHTLRKVNNECECL